MSNRLDDKMPVFDSVLDRPRATIHAFTEAELGLPMVQLRIDGEGFHLTVSQAERIGGGLLAAAKEAKR